jgi:asparagine synthase (glutamine-hydrolysing)
VRQLCYPDQVERLFQAFGGRGGKHEGAACWLLIFYALWHAIHIEGRTPHADIFATLTSK